MVAGWEVLQRVLDGISFLGEVAGSSKGEAQRIVASWGIDQRTGAVGFLQQLRNYTAEDAEKLIDNWNTKQNIRRAIHFLKKEHRYSEASAQTTATQWKMNEAQGKNAAIKFLIKEHGYEDLQAEKIVIRWGNTGDLKSVDSSPIYRSLRVVEGQGLWTRLGDEKLFSNKNEAQKVINLLLKHVYRNSEQIKDGETDEFTMKEERELRRLTTRLWRKTKKKKKSPPSSKTQR